MSEYEIEVKILPLRKLLEKNLTIPEYQRPYRWSFQNIDKLIEDLKEFLDSKSEEYYMGSILLHKEKNKDKFNIIDGQQRITTLLLLLIVLEQSDNKEINYENLQSKKRIKENYDYLHNKKSDLELIKNTFEKICLSIIITHNEDDAFTFFDTQNSRGVQPSVLVLLKAFNLRCINTLVVQEKYAKSWDKHERDKKNHLYEKPEKLEWLIKIFFYRLRNWRGNKKADFGYYEKYRDSFTKELRKSDNQEYKLFSSVKHIKTINEEFETISKAKSIDWFDFAVRQPIYKGEGFFAFIDHYKALLDELINMQIHGEKTFNQLLKVHNSGSVYMASFLVMVTLTYYDRFGKNNIEHFIKVINDLLVDVRLKSSRIVKQTLEKQFIRCENEHIDQNILDFICGAFDSQEVLEWVQKPNKKDYGTLEGVRKTFNKNNREFWREKNV